MNAGQYLRPVIEALEPRILYSADLAPGLPAIANAGLPPAESRLVSTAAPAGVSSLTEIAFVDSSLADTRLLVEDLEAQRAAGRDIEVVLIGSHEDGIRTIGATLAGRTDIGALHLFGHGSAGELRLGTGQLNAATLLQNANAIAGWSAAFTADADILLYGCNLASSPAGVAVADGLASLTGADVAASDDATGSPRDDADWELEYQQGTVEAVVAPGLRVQQMWTTALATMQVTATDDTYLSSNDQSFNYGGSTSLVVDHSGGGIGSHVALVKFDLSAIPAGATITNVTLQMQATANTGAFNLNVYEVTEAWDEGSGNGTLALLGDANWNQRQLLTSWTTPGGTFDPAVVATLSTAAVGTHSWDVTALAQAWYSGAKANHGLILGSPDGGGNVVTYDSAEGTTPPVLVITYTVPNTAPQITSDGGGASAVLSVAENTTAVTTVTATDADGTAPAYSLGGADAALFTLDAVSGALSFTSAPDFETPLDADADNVYEVTVTASDGSLSDNQALSITVTNVNDSAPQITSDGGGASAALSVAENTTAVTTVTATDADGTAPTYSLGGADAALFTLDAVSGALSFTSAPDFETPLDANADNVYEVTVTASDGSLSDNQALSITVTNVNDSAPQITSDGGGASAALGVAENTTAVTTVTATDADGTAPTYSLGGADAALFTLDAVSGALSFTSAPDFETPLDANADNVYEVTVTASDGSLSDNQALSITVTNVNDSAPQITSDGGGASAALSVAENTTAVTTVTATDADGTAPAYSLGGADAALFTLDAVSGALSFTSAPDFETPLDANADNVYEVTVTASDGSLSDNQALSITVTNVNDSAPIIALPSALFTETGIPLQIVGLAIADADSVDTNLLLTVSVVNGTLTVNADTPGGVPSNAITGNGTSVITLTGTIAQINATVAGGGSGIHYLAEFGFIGTTVVTVAVDDGGNPGGGPALRASRTVLISVSAETLSADLAPAVRVADVTTGQPDTSATAAASSQPEPGPQAVSGQQAASTDETLTATESMEIFDGPEVNSAGVAAMPGPQGLSAALRGQGSATVPAAFGIPQMFGNTLLASGDLSAALERLDYLNQLDGLRNTAEAPGIFEKQLAGFSAGGTIALSAGYVLWLLRGGALVASIVSSLPAWHFLDPLPVLRNSARSEDELDADDDEVENVFGGDRSDTANAPEDSDAGSGIRPRERAESDL